MKKRKVFILGLCALMALSLFPSAACGDGNEKVKAVYYSQYGAVGDGVTDDFDAIKATHAYANENGLKVKADKGASYYIGAHRDTVSIKTDTDWGNAKFIIDDSIVTVDNRSWNVFEVSSDSSSYKVDVPKGYSLKEGQTNLNMTFNTPVMLYIVNSNKKDYIRYGKNVNEGSSRQEIILVDEYGYVSEDTPVLWDYDTVTGMTAYPVDDKAITVEGGEFTTIANVEPVSTNYYARGINVRRSNARLYNIKHYITGEGDSSSPYTGFFVVNNANHVTVESCVMTGHTTYTNIKPTGAVQQGTYDTQAVRSNDVKWLNCKQTNEITDTKYWGIMASNFCKNLKMEGCKLSRFDAHQGVYNATITNSELGQNLSIVGAGTLLIENVIRSSGSHFVQLRTDYGSTWQGEIIFRNCTLKTTSSSCYAIEAVWNDWDFGYQCYLPETVTLDNFKVEGEAKSAYVFSSITSTSAANVAKSKNPLIIPQTVYVYNEVTPVNLSLNNSGLLNGTSLLKP